MKPRWIVPVLVAFLFASSHAQEVQAQSTAFLYQGNLKASTTPANGNYDFEFKLFDAVAGGSQLGSTFTALTVVVINGVFATTIDFGSQFPGANRFIEIGVRVAGGGGGYQQLLPRQQIASVPYGIRSQSAANADNAATAQNALALGGVAANQFVVTSDPRLSDSRNPLPGSASYIQNTTTTQVSSNFNISGTGKADTFDAATQYNIGGFRVFSAPGTGLSNTFAGYRSGNLSLTGTQNASLGYLSGESLTTGFSNALFGMGTGAFMTTGFFNTFAGTQAGYSTTTGDSNTFVGRNAGYFNVGGQNNAYFGISAGRNATVSGNSFFGALAGEDTSSGFANTFVGFQAGFGNVTGTYNTSIGIYSGFSSNNFSYATAIGADARAISSNSIMLGRSNGADHVQIPGNLTVTGTLNANLPLSDVYIQNQSAAAQGGSFNISGNGFIGGHLGVGTTSPTFKLQVIDPSNSGLRVQTNIPGGTVASFGGTGSFLVDAPGIPGGRFRVTENGNVGIGIEPTERLHVLGNAAFIGNVGIGTSGPVSKLEVNGTIHSSLGGFKFPDGSIQSTAVGTNTTYTAYRQASGTFTGNYETVLHLDLAAGNYSVMVSIEVVTDIAIGRRNVSCRVTPDGQIYGLWLTPENNLAVLSFHSVVNLQSPGGLDLSCAGGGGAPDTDYRVRRLTAMKLGDVIVQ